MIVTWANSGGGPAYIMGLGPAAWWRFGQGITVVTGVSQWNDQSGNSRHLLQAAGAAQPALQGDGSILFDGVNDFMTVTGGFTLNQPETVYLLSRQVTWTVNDRFADGNTANAGVIFQDTSTPTVSIFAGGAVLPNTNLALNTYGVVAAVFNGAGSLIQVNNTAPVTGAAGASNLGGFTLGATGGGGSNFGNIQVKEVILFPAAHDAATRASVIGYLSRL